ncbi:hypothetical protein DMC30DRAFT_410093 [Rhodotorula diobovata]|uniref:DUS-like FMN-binding domain-containing protein n=1 Tax=Rhodotorula diobovata TaxID=5288 RepID=A0A5C5FJI7_9BASI|nr:hypothetical protein DMC30DRAFT_410093 [Rhodotorula diobovata]
MVRIGTLPVRLLALDYGASLVWGPEIVDKAIIGATRQVDPRTGVVSFVKNGRSVFECHPLEKPRLIFQLGSADPQLAVEALRVIENDVAGVGLNCGCPKSFSLQGGMGAALLKDPERLCSILEALVKATDLPIDAKIRLLPLPEPSTSAAAPPAPAASDAAPAPTAPTADALPSATTPAPAPDTPTASSSEDPAAAAPPAEPTIPLVRLILSTGIQNLTVHCRTQSMRSSQPALLARMAPLVALARDRGVPIVVNGDGDGWGNFARTCEVSGGVGAVMVARGAEANVSCFRREGVLDPERDVIPRLLRVALATNNHYSNTKYLLNAMNLHLSPTPPSRERNRALKQAMNQARSYEAMCAAFGIGEDEVEKARDAGREGIERLVPAWAERRSEIVRDEGEY